MLAQQRLVCNGIALARFDQYWPAMLRDPATPLHSPKLDALRELLGALVIEQRRKVIVFSQWRRMLQLAACVTARALDAAGVCRLYFTGEENERRRLANLARFHDDPRALILWATDVGAHGLDLQHAASCVVHLEVPWNPAIREQRVARVHRIGQTEPVDVYTLITIDGIEGRIAHLNDTKQTLFRAMFETESAVDELRFAPDVPSHKMLLALAGISVPSPIESQVAA
jgi:SNF2 family DNA or RNA helicase